MICQVFLVFSLFSGWRLSSAATFGPSGARSEMHRPDGRGKPEATQAIVSGVDRDLRMPSFLIRERKVLGWIASRAAAPRGPSILPPVRSRVLMMRFRSLSWRVSELLLELPSGSAGARW